MWAHNKHVSSELAPLVCFAIALYFIFFNLFWSSFSLLLQSFKIILHLISQHLICPLCSLLHIDLASGCFYYTFVGLCLDICVCVSVSAENLEKSLRQMERQLLQLERDLETFSSPDDPNDKFFPKMDISFTYACIHSLVWVIFQFLIDYRILGRKIHFFHLYFILKNWNVQYNDFKKKKSQFI